LALPLAAYLNHRRHGGAVGRADQFFGRDYQAGNAVTPYVLDMGNRSTFPSTEIPMR
jgi:hypothetical protein